MGIWSDAVCGYGIEVTREDIDKWLILTEDEEEDGDFQAYLSSFLLPFGLDCESSGNAAAGDEMKYWILLNDPLNKDIEEFISKLQKTPFGTEIKTVKDLTWIKEVWTG